MKTDRKTEAKKPIRLYMLAVCVLLVVLSLFLFPWLFEFYTDGYSIHRPARGAGVREILWDPPKLLDGKINESMDNYEPTFSADGLTMIFTRGKALHNADLFLARFDGRAWSEPEPLARVNSEYDELGPDLSHDGRFLYFYSDRPGGIGGYDLWISRFNGDDWSAPENLGPEVNSAFNEYGPGLSPSGDRLFFSSNRLERSLTQEEKEAWQATLRENFLASDYDLFSAVIQEADGPELPERSALSEAPGRSELPALSELPDPPGAMPSRPVYKDVERVAVLNSPADEGQIAWTPRGDFLYFSSNRDGGLGRFDLYRSRILHGELQEPENLGGPVNSAFNDMDPSLIYEGHGLVFSSNRRMHEGKQPYRIFRSVSREVVVEHDFSALLPWLRALDKIKWPLLALLLLLLALLYLLRLLLKQGVGLQASLLHKCLLVSILLHLLLAFLTSTWLVTSSLYDLAGEDDGYLALNLDALAEDRMGLEIREQVADLEAPGDETALAFASDSMPPLEAALPIEQPSLTIEPFDPASGFAVDLPDRAAERTESPLPELSAHTDHLDPLAMRRDESSLEEPDTTTPEEMPAFAALTDNPAVALRDRPSVDRQAAPPDRSSMQPDRSLLAIPAPTLAPATVKTSPLVEQAGRPRNNRPERNATLQRAASRSQETAADLPELQPAIAMEIPKRDQAKRETDSQVSQAQQRSAAGATQMNPLPDPARTRAAPIPLAYMPDHPKIDWQPARVTKRKEQPRSLLDLPPRETVTEPPLLARYDHETLPTYHGLEMRSKRVIFCLDVSASMEWNNRIEEARQELLRLLDTLDDSVEFNIIAFSGSIRRWNSRGVQPGNPANVQAAKRFVRRMRIASDGTNTVGALTAALADRDVESIFFLSDGHPTTGYTTDADEILDTVEQLQDDRAVEINTIAYIKGEPPPEWRHRVPPKRGLIRLMQRLAERNNGNFVLCE